MNAARQEWEARIAAKAAEVVSEWEGTGLPWATLASLADAAVTSDTRDWKANTGRRWLVPTEMQEAVAVQRAVAAEARKRAAN